MSLTRRQKEEFKRTVYDIVRLIPAGRATTYGALAHAAGHPSYARMAGKIMSEVTAEDMVPAYRVVAAGGVLSGRHAFGEQDKMKHLLSQEGVVVVNNRIRNWKKVYWNPLSEL